MSFNTPILYIAVFILLSACNSTAQQQDSTPPEAKSEVAYTDLDVAAFKAKMTNEDVVILDVRTPQETAQGKIEGAVEINVLDPNFKDQVAKLDKDKTYLVYCRSGGRSVKACNLMAEQGFNDLYNLLGGYTSWQK